MYFDPKASSMLPTQIAYSSSRRNIIDNFWPNILFVDKIIYIRFDEVRIKLYQKEHGD